VEKLQLEASIKKDAELQIDAINKDVAALTFGNIFEDSDEGAWSLWLLAADILKSMVLQFPDRPMQDRYMSAFKATHTRKLVSFCHTFKCPPNAGVLEFVGEVLAQQGMQYETWIRQVDMLMIRKSADWTPMQLREHLSWFVHVNGTTKKWADEKLNPKQQNAMLWSTIKNFIGYGPRARQYLHTLEGEEKELDNTVFSNRMNRLNGEHGLDKQDKQIRPAPGIHEHGLDKQQDKQIRPAPARASPNMTFRREEEPPGEQRSGRRKPRDPSHAECYKCGQMGHFQYDCPTLKAESRRLGSRRRWE